jgi:hypothetical protein
MESNRHSVSKIRPKQGTNIRLKLSDEHYPLGGLWKLKLQVRHCPGKVGHYTVGPDIVRWEVFGNVIFSQNPSIFPNLILEL